MAKPPSTSLFKLIKNLTKSEKRQIRLIAMRYSTAHSGKAMQLYDIINKMTVYDEEKIKLKLYGKTGRVNALSVLKNNLFKLIMDGLVSLRTADNVSLQLDNLMPQIQVLYKKKLYDECWIIVQKAKNLAQSNELFIRLLDILKWEKKLIYVNLDVGLLKQQKKELFEMEKNSLNILLEQSEQWESYFDEVLLVKSVGVIRTENDRLEKESQSCLSHEAQVMHSKMKSLHHFSNGNFEEFYVTNLELLSHFKLEFIEEEPTYYISTLKNVAIGALLMRKYKDTELYIERFEEGIEKYAFDKYLERLEVYSIKLGLLGETGHFRKGVEVFNELKDEAAKHKKPIPNLFNYQGALMYFGVEDYDQARDYNDKFLSQGFIGEDYQSSARIFQLIVHFELGNSQFLESLLVSTYRYLLKRKRLFQFEKLVIKFIKNASNVYSKPKVLELIASFIDDVSDLMSNPKEELFLKYFNFLAWLKSKKSGKSFAQIISENAEINMR